MTIPGEQRLPTHFRRFLPIALLVVFSLPLIAHMIVGSHTRMMVDDFCTSYSGRSEGLIGGFITQYSTWAGQPSNIISKNAVGLAGSWVIPLLPPLVVAGWFIAILWTLSQVFKRLWLPHLLLVLAAAIFLFAILDGSPQIIQSLYWLAAVIPYTLPLVFATIFVGFLARTLQADNPPGISTLVFSGVFCFITGGFSESYIVVQLGLLLSGIAICILLPSPARRKRALPVLVAGLIGTVLVLFVILAAPGNAIRRASFPPAPPIPEMVTSALIHAVALVVTSLVAFSPIGAILTVAISSFIAYRHASHIALRIKPMYVLLFLMSVFVPITAYTVAGIYGTSFVPPARTYIIPQTLIVAALAAIGFMIGIKLRERGAFRAAKPLIYALGAVVMIGLLVFGPVRSTIRILDTLPAFQTFAAEVDQREQMIETARQRGETDVRVPPFTVDIAEAVGLLTIGADPAFWVNVCAAQYYGVETLATR